MFGRLIGALVGQRLAGPGQGARGALVGAAIPMIARRGLGPLSLALAAGYGIKKWRDARARRSA